LDLQKRKHDVPHSTVTFGYEDDDDDDDEYNDDTKHWGSDYWRGKTKVVQLHLNTPNNHFIHKNVIFLILYHIFLKVSKCTYNFLRKFK